LVAGCHGHGTRQRGLCVGSANRKATGDEMAHATQVIQEAFPKYEVVWGRHGDYGGARAPRDHTLGFRLRDNWGKYHSNVIWISPDWLSSITVEWVRKMVKRGTSNKPRSRRR
jgi:hypothetical protein